MSAFNGSGTFVVTGVGLPYVTATTISSTVANQLNTDLATGLSTTICKDGQTTPTANLPMGTFKHTGAGAASGTGQYLVYAQSAASLAGLTLTAALVYGGVTLSNSVTGTGSMVLASSPSITGLPLVGGVKTVYNANPNFNGGSGTDTGVSANAISQASGVTFMAYCSCQNAGGNGTYSAVYMVRVGASGNNINATRIALDAGSTGLGDYTFTAPGTTIVITPPGNVNTWVVMQQMTG